MNIIPPELEKAIDSICKFWAFAAFDRMCYWKYQSKANSYARIDPEACGKHLKTLLAVTIKDFYREHGRLPRKLNHQESDIFIFILGCDYHVTAMEIPILELSQTEFNLPTEILTTKDRTSITKDYQVYINRRRVTEEDCQGYSTAINNKEWKKYRNF